ncbi:Phospholipid-metabolizing enzyme A-C1-like [Aphelenchoides bicaudatus]|nr:Phospholipid-metabolizing enzyme A-C1-like [Aphelenchoides bicaudatus]
MLSEMSTLYSMDWLGADALAKTVKQGDLIEFRRTMPYKHWAVCVEINGESANRTTEQVKVVHLQPQFFGLRGTFSAHLFGHRGQVLIQTLADVHRGKACRINNVMDQRYTALGVGQIVQLALKKEGPTLYNLIYSNSEQFVNSCRYGRNEALEEHFPPLPVLVFILLVASVVPTPVTLGILAGILVFTILCICMQKVRQDRRPPQTVTVITDPKSISPQPRTIE